MLHTVYSKQAVLRMCIHMEGIDHRINPHPWIYIVEGNRTLCFLLSYTLHLLGRLQLLRCLLIQLLELTSILVNTG